MVNTRTPERPHEWSIELLRGVASILVVIAHYGPIGLYSSGVILFTFTGVDLFFVISGYVFAGQLFGAKRSVAEYAIRRFFRIYPLYLTSLATYVLLHAINHLPTGHIVEHLLFIHTLDSKETAFFYNPAFWSLPPEVEYYICLPLLALAIRHGARFSHIIGAALTITVLVALLRLDAPDNITPAYVLSVHLPGLLFEFLVGAAVWKVVQRGVRVSFAVSALAAGLAAWWVLGKLFSDKLFLISVLGDAAARLMQLLWGQAASICAAFVVLGVVSILRNGGSAIRTASIYSGKLSYGIYLFHNASLVIMFPLKEHIGVGYYLLACIGCTLTIAAVGHVVVEEPARQFGYRLGFRVRSMFAKLDA